MFIEYLAQTYGENPNEVLKAIKKDKIQYEAASIKSTRELPKQKSVCDLIYQEIDRLLKESLKLNQKVETILSLNNVNYSKTLTQAQIPNNRHRRSQLN